MDALFSNTYKGRFPFRLGTTSYIFRDTWAFNAEKLGPWLDEIELVLFESGDDALPTAEEVRTLRRLSGEHDFSYNVHLPIDIRLGSADGDVRRRAVESVRRVAALTGGLEPSTFTLHLEFEGDPADAGAAAGWRKRVADSLRRLVDAGLPPEKFSVENLTYPFEIVDDLVRAAGFRVCFDVGHQLLVGGDLRAAYRRNAAVTDIVHLCGIGPKGEHLSLERLPETAAESLMPLLGDFRGTLSLEVFSYENLVTSLTAFDRLWERRGPQTSPQTPGEGGRDR